MVRSLLVCALFAALLAACGEEDTGPEMRPGDNCLRCHSSGGEASEVRFTAAGTVFPAADAAKSDGVEGAIVRLQKADGGILELRTNRVGNFFTRERLAADLRPEVEFEGRVEQMPVTANGACNSCHNQPPSGAATGRIFVP